ncbi:hypothetical protein T05_4457 [Trichinella murrelli]|uniref:Uncharacterized protein n=1 Tax=Trichinella murrelli TaxID=144512 RepID=A0A0V0TRL4_9BILA|nr:hypothetical protein T05_4457 [Trichinella murrelli]
MQVTLFYQISLVKEVTYPLQLRRSLQFVSDCDIFIICISVTMSEAVKIHVTPYVYYLNWNLANCPFAITDRDFECVFRMCDRKWYSMSLTEKQPWIDKCHDDKQPFVAHKLLNELMKKVQKNAANEHTATFRHATPFPTFATSKIITIICFSIKELEDLSCT